MIPFDFKKPDLKSKFYQDKFGKFIKAFRWVNEKGDWVFCTAYYNDGTIKSFLRFNYKEKTKEWRISHSWQDAFFFNAKKIIETEKPIVLVNNEMAIEILNQTNKEDFIFTTWLGDITDIEKTDFSILKNKDLYYFSESHHVQHIVTKFLKKQDIELKIVPSIVDRPGWNIVDDLPGMKLDRETLRAWILNERYETKQEYEYIDDGIKWPFKILGPNAEYFFYLQGENGQIFRVKQGSLNTGHMMNLAPLEFWEDMFGYETKTRGIVISWINAQNVLIRESNKKPPFDINKIRGRGIWQDGDKLVIHTGKELIYGERKIKITKYSPNGHVYERINELKLNIKKLDIGSFEILQVKNCIEKLSINTALEKMFLLGWCVLAPFGGALSWRPHIWLTGSSGSGKTAVLTMIILKMLGDFKLYAEGGSTAAGIFQKLKKNNDSFPVVHDEVDKKGTGSIEAELEIVRSCSSTQGKMYKGTAGQDGIEYHFNSMFCLSSVNTILNQKSDRSRFSVINITKNENINWKEFRREIRNTFTDEMCEKIRSLFFYNWNTAKKTIENFKDAAGTYCGDQRTGDQVGTLMAGFFLLSDFKIYEYDEIIKICEKYLKNYADEDNFMTDEIELLNKIFTSKIRYAEYENRIIETTLLNLLKRAAGESADTTGPDNSARKELYKYGINYQHNIGKLCIAYKYEWLRNILKETPWYHNYGEVLKRLSFAKNKTEIVYFGNFYTGRAIVLDAIYILRLSDDKLYMETGID